MRNKMELLEGEKWSKTSSVNVKLVFFEFFSFILNGHNLNS